MGNAHPSIAPYELLNCADGPLAVACGNDGQFKAILGVLDLEEFLLDERFSTNCARVTNRTELVAMLESRLATGEASVWQAAFGAVGVPAGQVGTIESGIELAESLGLAPTISVQDATGSTVGRQIRNPITWSPPLAPYLLRTVAVAAGDGERSLSTPLTRYYSAQGTPPGRWLGSGLRRLDDGLIVEGDAVTEAQLQLLIGLGRDPMTGEALGRAYPVYGTAADRASAGRGEDDLKLGTTERASGAASSDEDQPGGGRRRAVAGYDFTFSIPKSAIILWGVADATVQARIVQAHHAAVAEVIAYMERDVAATRTGVTVRDGPARRSM
jgi:hypothetical protein